MEMQPTQTAFAPGSHVAIGKIMLPPELTRNPSAMYEQILGLVEASNNKESLRESLSVRLATDTAHAREGGMYGWRLRDSIGERKRTLDMSMYSRTSATAMTAVTNTDPVTGNVKILMARKYKDMKHPELGLADEIVMPGGYIKGNPPTGATPEEKEGNDLNLEATARRELREETGLVIPEDMQGKLVDFNSSFGEANINKVHSISTCYHYHFTQPESSLPVLEAKDDIAAIYWVDATAITKTGEKDDVRYHVALSNGENLPIGQSMDGKFFGLSGEYTDNALRSAYLAPYRHRIAIVGDGIKELPSAVGPEGKAAFANMAATIAVTAREKAQLAERTIN